MEGRQANKICKTLTFATKTIPEPKNLRKEVHEKEQHTDLDTLIQKLTEYFIPKRKTIQKQAYFSERVQGKEESVEEFVRDLQDREQYCSYDDADAQARDKFVFCLPDTEVKQKFELYDDISLVKAVAIARRHELVKAQIVQQSAKQKEINEAKVQKTGSRKPTLSKGTKPKRGQSKHQSADRCTKTDSCSQFRHEVHKKGVKCPVNGQACHKCKKVGYFTLVCRDRDCQWRVNRADEVSADAEATYFLGSLDGQEGVWYQTLTLEGTSVEFKYRGRYLTDI